MEVERSDITLWRSASPADVPCREIGAPAVDRACKVTPTIVSSPDPDLNEIAILGYRMHPRTGDEVVAEIERAVTARRRLIMANVNLHAMAVMFESPRMASLLTQDDTVVMIDSMPILFMAKAAGFRLPRTKRTTSLDFYDEMFLLGIERGWRFAYVGALPGTLKRGLDALRQRFPGLDIEGRSGFFDATDMSEGSEQQDVLAWLQASSHDVLIVGMGMPRQEEWIDQVQHLLPTRVLLSAGAYLDYQAGVQQPTPRWLGQLGIEWVYRLVHSPRRLGYRYLVEPFVLGARLIGREHPQGWSRRKRD